MKNNYKFFSFLPILLALLLVGAGCQYATDINNDYSFDESMMQEEDSSMMQEEDNSMIDNDESMMEEESAMMGDDESMIENKKINFSGQVLAGSSSPLLDFNKSDYDKALASDKLILLYFYANWCPICAEETKNSLYPAFNELTNDSLIGFRVNYNVNQTDSNEKELAREFGIAYQHSKVILKNGKRVLKAPNSWTKQEYLKQINNYLK